MSKYDIRDDVKYTSEHEWAKITGGESVFGVTDYAQKSLGDVVFVELPKIGDEVYKGSPLGVLESVKAVSDFYSPLSGVIVAINEKLLTSPEIVNSDPYGEGWLVKIKIGKEEEIPELLTHDEYLQFLGEEA